MFRFTAVLSVLALMAAPAYAGWGCGSGGGGYYAPSYSYGSYYSGCGSYGGYYSTPYYSQGCGVYAPSYMVVKRGCFGGYRVYSAPTYYYGTQSCTPSTVTSPLPTVETPQQTDLPDSYYQEPTPAQKPDTPSEPGPVDDRPAAPAESFQSTTSNVASSTVSYTSLKTAPVKTAPGILVLRCPADAKVYINGYETKMTGTTRKYVSHNLKEGHRYKYEVVVVRNDGKRFRGVASLTAGETRKLN